MSELQENFKEWDQIFQQREEYLKEHPEENKISRPKTYTDEDGVLRCTKCGGTENFATCPECEAEKSFLRIK